MDNMIQPTLSVPVMLRAKGIAICMMDCAWEQVHIQHSIGQCVVLASQAVNTVQRTEILVLALSSHVIASYQCCTLLRLILRWLVICLVYTDMPIKLVYVHMEQAGLVPRPLLENQEGIWQHSLQCCVYGRMHATQITEFSSVKVTVCDTIWAERGVG